MNLNMNEKIEFGKSVGSSNLLIWKYFGCLDMIEKLIGKKVTFEDDILKLVMMSVFMTVACIETFFNTYFRELLEDAKYEDIREKMLPEFDNFNLGLNKKLKRWPDIFFNKNIYGSNAGKEFVKYKDIRNNLMHYKHTYESIKDRGGIEFKGLTDLSVYDNLNAQLAFNAKTVVINLLKEVFIAAGISKGDLKPIIQKWTGEIIDNIEAAE
jgi:hypothetical protein